MKRTDTSLPRWVSIFSVIGSTQTHVQKVKNASSQPGISHPSNAYDRDMANEKFGFMLIFWNMAGVPFTYGHATLFLANHPPSAYRWPIAYNLAVYVLLLGSYYIWDTTNSQKNRFRQQMNGTPILRKTFPQLPWQTVKNPQILHTKAGPLMADGWYKYGARKIHYTMDIVMALCWGLACGFSSVLPYWYVIWITTVVVQRAIRDVSHCRAKYGEEWKEYEKLCPYMFIPVCTPLPFLSQY
jgi:Delta24(24(1))-sterol reductase